MTARPFEAHPLSQPSPAARQDSAIGQTTDDESKGRAVTELLQHGVFRQIFGKDGEYEVRTTMTTRRSWQYRCCVLCRGKPIKRAFPPIVVDHPHHRQTVQKQLMLAKAMRHSFAWEAVEVHFTRCAALQEYLMMAMIYSVPRLESRRRYALPMLLGGAACLLVYGLWTHTLSTDNNPPPASPPSAVQRVHHSVVGPDLTEPSLKTPPSEFNGAVGSDIVNRPGGEPRTTPAAETPKAVQLFDLIVLQVSSNQPDHASRAPVSRAPQASSAADVQAGDLLQLSGWVHRVSRATDRAYHLQISPSPRSAAPSLIAVAPPPDQPSTSTAVRTQLQAVRTFITQRLLRQKEPSPRGSVIRQPIFVQLTGQLSYSHTPPAEASQHRGAQDSSTGWEVRPVTDIRFATPTGQPERSRPR
jgi:hypothetical protein